MPHIHALIDFTAEVYIVYKDKVLLRKHDKYKIWLGIGGHIELNEDPNEAAIREAMEEVNLEIELEDSLKGNYPQNQTRELIPPYFLNRHRINNEHEHIALVYFARSKTDNISETIEREKSTQCKWFTRSELEQNEELSSNVRFYALKALEKLSN